MAMAEMIGRWGLGMKRAVVLAMALACLGFVRESQAKIVETEISPPHQVFVRDLIGLSPAQVQVRLTGFEENWPRAMSFEALTSQGVLSFAVITDYVQDAASLEIIARGRNRALDGMPTAWSACTVKTDEDAAYDTLLMFKDDKLEGVWGKRHATDTTSDRAEGQLPLEEGEAFMTHWGRTLMSRDSSMTIRCAKHESIRDRPLAVPAHEGLSAGDLQGAALLPFAAELPFMNANRTANRRRGVDLYEQLGPGYSLPGGLQTFLSSHNVASVIRGRDQNYAILKIDLGAYAGRNLSNSDDFGLVGVRGGVVQWRALAYSSASPDSPAKARR